VAKFTIHLLVVASVLLLLYKYSRSHRPQCPYQFDKTAAPDKIWTAAFLGHLLPLPCLLSASLNITLFTRTTGVFLPT
jgi:hypothetical protein